MLFGVDTLYGYNNHLWMQIIPYCKHNLALQVLSIRGVYFNLVSLYILYTATMYVYVYKSKKNLNEILRIIQDLRSS